MKLPTISHALFAAVLALTPGCMIGMQGAKMTPEEIRAHGTQTFKAPVDEVFAATEAALKLEGYDVAISNADKGLIKTKRKFVRADATGNQYAVMAVEATRQYEVTIKDDGAGGTIVTATPYVYQGEADLSKDAVWQLDGPVGERTLWQRLFKDIGDSL